MAKRRMPTPYTFIVNVPAAAVSPEMQTELIGDLTEDGRTTCETSGLDVGEFRLEIDFKVDGYINMDILIEIVDMWGERHDIDWEIKIHRY